MTCCAGGTSHTLPPPDSQPDPLPPDPITPVGPPFPAPVPHPSPTPTDPDPGPSLRAGSVGRAGGGRSQDAVSTTPAVDTSGSVRTFGASGSSTTVTVVGTELPR